MVSAPAQTSGVMITPWPMCYMAELLLIFSLLISYLFLSSSFLRITGGGRFLSSLHPETTECTVFSRTPETWILLLNITFFLIHSEKQINRWTTGCPYTQGCDPIRGHISWSGFPSNSGTGQHYATSWTDLCHTWDDINLPIQALWNLFDNAIFLQST